MLLYCIVFPRWCHLARSGSPAVSSKKNYFPFDKSFIDFSFDQDGWILTPFVGKFTLERTRLIDNVNPLLMPKVTAYIAIYEQSESCVDSSLLKTRLYCICMTI